MFIMNRNEGLMKGGDDVRRRGRKYLDDLLSFGTIGKLSGLAWG